MRWWEKHVLQMKFSLQNHLFSKISLFSHLNRYIQSRPVAISTITLYTLVYIEIYSQRKNSESIQSEVDVCHVVSQCSTFFMPSSVFPLDFVIPLNWFCPVASIAEMCKLIINYVVGLFFLQDCFGCLYWAQIKKKKRK